MTIHRPWRRRCRCAAAAVLLVTTAAACGSGDDNGDSGDVAEARDVVMKLVAFEPERLEVEAGTTVAWQQRDPGAHTVTSGTVEQGGAGVSAKPDGLFDSGDLATGESFERTFAEPGTYPYFCSLHPATMRGAIRVT